MRKRWQRTLVAALTAGLVTAAGLACSGCCLAAEPGPNLVKCPDFAEGEDISPWYRDRGNATITAEAGAEPVYGDVASYGKITDRTTNYECFSQDVTGLVEKDKDYVYSFYVMLDAADYGDAPSQQRCVEISPYITADGNTVYSQGCSGTVSQVLEPGVWTHFTGTYTPTWSGELEQVVIRILEQGTEYGQGEGVMGTYYMTGMELRAQETQDSVIQTDVPRLRDAVPGELGEAFTIGTSIVNSDLKDGDTMALVTRHFNAITLGNELKPDAMFGYSNQKCPGTETVTLNGESLEVPKMDYSRAERTLDAIYDWNQSHPDDLIKVRGHVLVWHSQTPEWFFHEEYNVDKPYVDKQTMLARMENYIKQVMEHYEGEDSEYRGMIYAWDVVNEAVNDTDGGMRTDSSWFRVFYSFDYVEWAFVYANRYAPAHIKLFYNDYNDINPKKADGICKLMEQIKSNPEARIDGMGMQGHYDMNFSDVLFKQSARKYAAVVDEIQITELDLKASTGFDGTDMEEEYQKQADVYKSLYDAVKSLKQEGVPITAIVFWGTDDRHSWLQSANAAGGSADGTRVQCPLLFDKDYQKKPAFWAFVDESKLEGR